MLVSSCSVFELAAPAEIHPGRSVAVCPCSRALQTNTLKYLLPHGLILSYYALLSPPPPSPMLGAGKCLCIWEGAWVSDPFYESSASPSATLCVFLSHNVKEIHSVGQSRLLMKWASLHGACGDSLKRAVWIKLCFDASVFFSNFSGISHKR